MRRKLKLGRPIGTNTSPLTAHARRKPVYGPLPEAHPFYAIVERVTFEWAHLEHALDMIIWELAGMDQNLGSCVTSQLSGQWPRINAIMALATARGVDKTLIREFELFGKKCSELVKKRSRFAQDAWYSDCDGKFAQLIDLSVHEKQLGPKDSSNGDALELISRIDARIIELWQIHSRLRTSLQTLQ